MSRLNQADAVGRAGKGATGSEEARYQLSQWRLVWAKLRRHRLAVVSLWVLLVFYMTALFAEFFAPALPTSRKSEFPLAPPQVLRFMDTHGRFHLRPFVSGITLHVDPETFSRNYQVNAEEMHPLRLLQRGDRYRLWGLIESDLHLFGIADQEAAFFLFGSDRQGRDMLSRTIFASRISLSIGLIGVVMSFVMGIVLGGISGWYGGFTDNLIQRFIEILRSFPTLPLWMALSASLPIDWPILRVYFFITIILSLIGWTGMARVVRGKFLSLRTEYFVIAAQQAGARVPRILFKHMLPSFMSHVIASATLSVPAMILGETSLSFLGVGLRAPAVSWGVLLQRAQNVQSVVRTSWLLIPALFVIVAVLAFNFLGDGMRDAADPYH